MAGGIARSCAIVSSDTATQLSRRSFLMAGPQNEEPILLHKNTPPVSSCRVRPATATADCDGSRRGYDARSQSSSFDRVPPYGLYCVAPLPTTSTDSLSPSTWTTTK